MFFCNVNKIQFKQSVNISVMVSLFSHILMCRPDCLTLAECLASSTADSPALITAMLRCNQTINKRSRQPLKGTTSPTEKMLPCQETNVSADKWTSQRPLVKGHAFVCLEEEVDASLHGFCSTEHLLQMSAWLIYGSFQPSENLSIWIALN